MESENSGHPEPEVGGGVESPESNPLARNWTDGGIGVESNRKEIDTHIAEAARLEQEAAQTKAANGGVENQHYLDLLRQKATAEQNAGRLVDKDRYQADSMNLYAKHIPNPEGATVAQVNKFFTVSAEKGSPAEIDRFVQQSKNAEIERGLKKSELGIEIDPDKRERIENSISQIEENLAKLYQSIAELKGLVASGESRALVNERISRLNKPENPKNFKQEVKEAERRADIVVKNAIEDSRYTGRSEIDLEQNRDIKDIIIQKVRSKLRDGGGEFINYEINSDGTSITIYDHSLPNSNIT